MSMNQGELKQLILVPAIITLAVTLIRLAGELMGGSSLLFSAEAGGGGAIIGISWLIPLFGIYFGWKLAKGGQASSTTPGKTLLWALVSLAVVIVVSVAVFALLGQTSIIGLIIFSVAAVGLMFLVRKGWPELFAVLLKYALAARIPVVVVMFIAIMGDWGTHYDVPPTPDFPQMNWFLKWIVIGVIPQMTVWIWFTITVGAIFGGLTLIFAKKS